MSMALIYSIKKELIAYMSLQFQTKKKDVYKKILTVYRTDEICRDSLTMGKVCIFAHYRDNSIYIPVV